MKKKKAIHHHAKTPKPAPDPFSTLIWQTHEFAKPEPSKWWYTGVITALLIIVAILLYFKLYGLIGSALIVTLLIIFEVNLEPRLVRVELNRAEIKFGEKKFSYSQVKTYSIMLIKQKKHLVLQTVVPLMTLVDIPLGKQSEEEIRQFLDKHIPFLHLTTHPREKFVFWR